MVLSSCTLAVIYNWSLVLWIVYDCICVYGWLKRIWNSIIWKHKNYVNVSQHEVNKPLTASSLTISRGGKEAPQNLHYPSSSQWSFIQLSFNFSASFHNLLSSKVINGQISYTLIKIPFLMNSLIECKSLCALLILKCKDNCNGQHEKGLIIACRLLWILIGLIA